MNGEQQLHPFFLCDLCDPVSRYCTEVAVAILACMIRCYVVYTIVYTALPPGPVSTCCLSGSVLIMRLAILRCSDPHGWILYSSSCCRKGKIMNFKKSGKILILKITFIAMCLFICQTTILYTEEYKRTSIFCQNIQISTHDAAVLHTRLVSRRHET